MQYKGTVIAGASGVGSKSERKAAKLVTADGTYLLRRRDENAFDDPVLDRLVGKTIECDGHLTSTTLIISDWREV